MRTLAINNSEAGGSWKFVQNCLLDREDVTYLTPRMALKHGLISFSINSLGLLCKLSIMRLLNKDISSRIISMHTTWINSKLFVEYCSQFDEVFVFRWVNMLSLNDLCTISHCTRLRIVGVDDSLITPYCSFIDGCSEFHKGCFECPKCDPRRVDIVRADNYSALEIASSFSNNTLFIGANYEYMDNFKSSYWASSCVSYENRIWPYRTFLNDKEINAIKKANSARSEVNILIASLRFTRRKGSHLIPKLLEFLDANIPSNRNVTFEIVVSELPSTLRSLELKNINLITHPPMSSEEFEKKMAVVDLFLSLSLVDTGPFTINIAHALRTPIIAFNIGVAKLFADRNDSLIETIEKGDIKKLSQKVLEFIIFK